jgi:hypothetical protein
MPCGIGGLNRRTAGTEARAPAATVRDAAADAVSEESRAGPSSVK